MFNYSARTDTRDGIPVVRLADATADAEVWIVPSLGNAAFDMRVHGHPVFWSPYTSLADFQAHPVLLGNCLLAPWANRLSQEAYYANGRKYFLNPSLDNYRYDANHKPIHGLLAHTPHWELASVATDDVSAQVTSRLEFWAYPELMAQFPFAHKMHMTYRLSEGALEVRTSILNQSREPMPLVIGYHPYFMLTDAPRDEWTVHVAAREHVLLSEALIPTGEREPVTLPDPAKLADSRLDDVFTSLIRDPQNHATFWVRGKRQQISVTYGPKYTVAIVYAPPGREFICFEPMTGVTNGFNLAQEGLYDELQSIPPGARWEESFWVRPEGFE